MMVGRHYISQCIYRPEPPPLTCCFTGAEKSWHGRLGVPHSQAALLAVDLLRQMRALSRNLGALWRRPPSHTKIARFPPATCLGSTRSYRARESSAISSLKFASCLCCFSRCSPISPRPTRGVCMSCITHQSPRYSPHLIASFSPASSYWLLMAYSAAGTVEQGALAVDGDAGRGSSLVEPLRIRGVDGRRIRRCCAIRARTADPIIPSKYAHTKIHHQTTTREKTLQEYPAVDAVENSHIKLEKLIYVTPEPETFPYSKQASLDREKERWAQDCHGTFPMFWWAGFLRSPEVPCRKGQE